jgi:hypothetical protein
MFEFLIKLAKMLSGLDGVIKIHLVEKERLEH